MAWMSDKQASVVRKRVFSIQNTIKRRKAKRFIEAPREREGVKQLSSAHQSQDLTEVNITDSSIIFAYKCMMLYIRCLLQSTQNLL